MTNWELFRHLCLIIGGQRSETLGEIIDQGAFERLAELAHERDLLPALACRLDEYAGSTANISAEIRDKLTQALKENTGLKLQIKAQAIKLTRALNAVGIEPIFLKGTAQLLTNSNLAVGFRKQVDIDLLVRPGQIEATCEALKHEGYRFYNAYGDSQETFNDTARALTLGAHHHHLPPMVKEGYSATLEIHKHPLRRRFDRALPVKQLLESTLSCDSHGAKFLVPTPDLQLLQLTLGDFIHDGYAARFDFPVRAGHDYIAFINQYADNAGAYSQTGADSRFNSSLPLFEQLVTEFMGLSEEKRIYPPRNIQNRLKLMEMRCNMPSVARALDQQARWRYLGLSLWYDSGKLSAYLARKRGSKQLTSVAAGHR